MRLFGCFFVFVLMVGAVMAQGETGKRAAAPQRKEQILRPDFAITNSGAIGQGGLAYNADGNFQAVASDKGIRIYDLRPSESTAAKLVRTLSSQAAQISGFGFSATNTLVSVSLDQTVKIWDFVTGNILHSAEVSVAKKSGIVIAPGDNSLAADLASEKVRLWNYRTGEVLKTFEPGDSWPSALAFTPNGKSLVIGTEKGVLRVMDVGAWKVVHIVDLDSPILSLAASAEHIVLGYSDGTVATVNLGDRAPVPERKKQSGAINALAFSPNGKEFVSASADHSIKVWAIAGLNPLYSLEGHGAPVAAVSFSPDGNRLASMDEDGGVNFWTVPAK